MIRASSGTNFESELFTIELIIPSAMLMVPLQVRLIGCIAPHPNPPSTTGVVDMNILAEYQLPAIQLLVVLCCVHVLLGAPNLDSF